VLSRFGRAIFTSTALAPVGFTYAVAAWGENRRAALTAAAVSAGLWLIAALFMKLAKSQLERVPLQPTGIEAADQENIAFLLLYLSPFFTTSVSEINWPLLIPTFVVFAAVTATGYNYHFSPLLALMGWHAYRVTDDAGVTSVVFTRKQMRAAITPLVVVQLTEYVLLDTS
jgi:hypothetical protein